MYTIFKNSAPLGYTDSPVFIRLQSNGCYGLCKPQEAQGVVFNGTPYHLLGKPDIPGLETVMVVETDGGYAMEKATKVDQIRADLDFISVMTEVALV